MVPDTMVIETLRHVINIIAISGHSESDGPALFVPRTWCTTPSPGPRVYFHQPLPIMTIRVRRSSIEQGRESPAMRQKRLKSFSTLHYHRSGAGGGDTSSAADVKGFAASHAANRQRSINLERVVKGYVVIAELHHQQYYYV